MKNYVFAVFAFLMVTFALLRNPIEAHAENYYWAQESTESSAAWYKADRPGSSYSIKLENAPELTEEDWIIVDCAPDEACSEWLRNLSGNVPLFTSFYDGDLILGSENGAALTVVTLNAYRGNITVYGDVRYARVETCSLNIQGNVTTELRLGNEQSPTGKGTILVSGNVQKVIWFKEELRPDMTDNSYLVGFSGCVNIGGSVVGGEIFSVVYDDVINKSVWHQTGEILACANGVFQMQNGTLSTQVGVTEIQPELGNYKFSYACYSRGSTENNYFVKEIIDANTNQHAFFEDCLISDIPDGAQLIIYGVAKKAPIIIEADLGYLRIEVETDNNGSITVDGNVDYVEVVMNGISDCNLTINGNVGKLIIHYIYNPLYNISVNGKVEYGFASSALSSRRYPIGWFVCENMQILKNGDWNPELVLSTSVDKSTASYKAIPQSAIHEALEANGVGQEFTTSSAGQDIKLTKDAAVSLEATSASQLSAVQNTNEMKSALAQLAQKESDETLTAQTVCAVDIHVNTYYMNQQTGGEYAGDSTYAAETITELAEGEELSFTVQLPESVYEEGTQYYVVREHKDGSTTVVDELQVTQQNNQLTFSSDKYSTFIIVKLAEGVQEEEEDIAYRYICMDGSKTDNKNIWNRFKLDPVTKNPVGSSEVWSVEELPPNADIQINSTDKNMPVVLEMDIKRLNVSASSNADVTVKGNVEELVVKDAVSGYRVIIEGKVNLLRIECCNRESTYLEVTEGADLCVFRANHLPQPGYFEGRKGVLIQNGKWMEDLEIKIGEEEFAVSYQPFEYEVLEEVLVGYDLGSEVSVPNGNNTIELKKMAAASVSQYESDSLNQKLTDVYLMDSIKKIEQAESDENEEITLVPVAGFDISLSTYYAFKTNGAKYTANPVYGETAVKELKNGKQLSFSFNFNAPLEETTYFVLRRHEETDGRVIVDKLPAVVNGSILTFASDKFSDFIVVKTQKTSAGGQGSSSSIHNHTAITVNATDANCGNEGYTGDVVCADCGEVLQNGTIIPMQGEHHWSDWKTGEGIAYTYRECWNCGNSEYLNANPAASVTGTVPATGDQANVVLWLMTVVACCGLAVFAAKKMRKAE